jgi:hypothetical protein
LQIKDCGTHRILDRSHTAAAKVNFVNDGRKLWISRMLVWKIVPWKGHEPFRVRSDGQMDGVFAGRAAADAKFRHLVLLGASVRSLRLWKTWKSL